MLQPHAHITLALSQFFQNDDPGLAWAHALQSDTPEQATAAPPSSCRPAAPIDAPDAGTEAAPA